MKFIRELSDKWVDLYSENSNFFVIRKTTRENLQDILSLYTEIDSISKPQIINTNWQDKLVEEYIFGDLLLKPEYNKLSKVIPNILLLSSKKKFSQEINNYLKDNFSKKLKSIDLNHNQIEVVKWFFETFLSDAKENKIELNWVHWDLKWDNILIKDNVAYLIDWEWCKIWHYVEDIQKILDSTLDYDKVLTDDFLNMFYKYKPINWSFFVFLESFHFFLNQTLKLSKNKLTLDEFQRIVSEKINSMINNDIYTININWKSISLWTRLKPSNIFEYTENQSAFPEHIMFNPNMNNQEQRLEINKWLMLKNKNFLVLHWSCIKLKNWKNILIWWLSWSWKTYIYNILKNAGLIDYLYDEDLICLYKDWRIKWLWQKTFKWNIDWKYIYELNNIKDYEKLDIAIFLSNNINWLYNSIFSNNNVLNYLLPERYYSNPELEEHYSNFFIERSIQAYILWNDKKFSNFSDLIKKIWKK